LMDYLKTQAPFWKKEQTQSGARWVDARSDDDAALARWGIAGQNAGHAEPGHARRQAGRSSKKQESRGARFCHRSRIAPADAARGLPDLGSWANERRPVQSPECARTDAGTRLLTHPLFSGARALPSIEPNGFALFAPP